MSARFGVAVRKFQWTGRHPHTAPSQHPAGNPRAHESQANRSNKRREPQLPPRCRSRTPPETRTRGAQTACLHRSSSSLGKIVPCKRSFYRIRPHPTGHYLNTMFPKFIRPCPKPLDAGRNGWSSIAPCQEKAKRSFGEDMEADPLLFRDLTYVFL